MAFVVPTNFCIRTDGSDTANGGGSGSACVVATPSAPTVTPSSSGGTIAAGTYYIVITINDQFSETSKSATTSVVLTGATSSFVVTAPAAAANLMNWNVYVGTSATGPFWPQGTSLVMGTNRSVTTTPPTSGTQPPGTSYINQASPQFTWTDLIIAGTNTIISSMITPFTADMVRSVIVVTAGVGFTAQRAQILSVDASGNATMDRAMGTAASVMGSAALGGALATPGFAASFLLAGSGMFQRSGTYSQTSSSSNVSNGKPSLPGGTNTGPRRCFWAGYATTFNDGGAAPLNQASGAISSFAMGTSVGNGWVIENINFDGANKSIARGVDAGASFGRIKNCKFVNFSNAAINLGVGSIAIENCEITTCTSVACILSPGGGDTHIYGCNIHGNSIHAISTATNLHISKTQIYSNSGASSDGILLTSAVHVQINDCSFYANGRHHINSTFTGSILSIVTCRNSIFEAAGGWGATASQISPVWDFRNCSFFNNTSGEINTAVIPTYSGKTSLVSTPYTNAASGDLSLNNTTNAGAACRAASTLGIFPGGTSTGYADRGAVQHVDPSGGGGQSAYAFVG